MGLKSLVRTIIGGLFDEYRIDWIFASPVRSEPQSDAGEPANMVPVGPDHLRALGDSRTAKVRNSLSFNRSGMLGYVLLEEGVPVCVAHFCDAQQYDRAGTWPLRPGEMALMDIATEEHARGRGHAVRLIQAATNACRARGATRLIAFIWWSNAASVRAFTKAGWRRIGLSIEVRIGTRWHSLRLPLKARHGHPSQRPRQGDDR